MYRLISHRLTGRFRPRRHRSNYKPRGSLAAALPAVSLAVLLCSCSTYDVTLNDQVVYTPAQLYQGYQIPDDGLRHCIERSITQNRVTKAEQLVELTCINAGIASLEGLEHFTGLQYLDLTGNFDLVCPQDNRFSHIQELFLPEPCL